MVPILELRLWKSCNEEQCRGSEPSRTQLSRYNQYLVILPLWTELGLNMGTNLHSKDPYPSLCHPVPSGFLAQCTLWTPRKGVPTSELRPFWWKFYNYKELLNKTQFKVHRLGTFSWNLFSFPFFFYGLLYIGEHSHLFHSGINFKVRDFCKTFSLQHAKM